MLLAFFASATVGTLDEFMQWLVPVRAADFHDVLLNAYSAAAGIALGVALVGLPEGWRPRLGRDSWLAVAWGLTGMLLVGGVYLQVAHLGYRVVDPAIGSFRSLFSREELLELREERAERCASRAPRTSELALALRARGLLPHRGRAPRAAAQPLLQGRGLAAGGESRSPSSRPTTRPSWSSATRPARSSVGDPPPCGRPPPGPEASTRSTRAGRGPVARDPAIVYLSPTRLEMWAGIALVLSAVWVVVLSVPRPGAGA